MARAFSRWAIFFLSFSLILQACGESETSRDSLNYNESLPPPPFSKELGLKCFGEGDLACAKKQYCGVSGDAQAARRCCLATFLSHYFSENTAELGEWLGYSPVSFAEVRDSTLDDLIQKKALPFAELVLLSDADAPPVRELLKKWALALSGRQASTAKLQEMLQTFGSGLEATAVCIDQTLAKHEADELEPQIFASQAKVPIRTRDLLFARFILGLAGYSLQNVATYEWGADQFPLLPLDDAFIQDLNGQAGQGDARFGELDPIGAAEVAGDYPHLEKSFQALKQFSGLAAEPSRIDAYLNWRFSKEFQEGASAWLLAMYRSIQEKTWQNLPDGEHQINLSSLSSAKTLPNSASLDAELVFLSRAADGSIEVNSDFLSAWAANLVK